MRRSCVLPEQCVVVFLLFFFCFFLFFFGGGGDKIYPNSNCIMTP